MADPPSDIDARIAIGMPIVDKLARRLARRAQYMVEFDDLRQIGRMALIEAAPEYDATHGASLSGWLVLRIRGAMIDHMQLLTGHSRQRVRAIRDHHAAQKASTGTFERIRYSMQFFATPNSQRSIERLRMPGTRLIRGDIAYAEIERHPGIDGHETPSEELVHREQQERVSNLLTELRTEERTLLHDHYLNGKSLAEIARQKGKSRSWLSRIHTRALENAREAASHHRDWKDVIDEE